MTGREGKESWRGRRGERITARRKERMIKKVETERMNTEKRMMRALKVRRGRRE